MGGSTNGDVWEKEAAEEAQKETRGWRRQEDMKETNGGKENKLEVNVWKKSVSE